MLDHRIAPDTVAAGMAAKDVTRNTMSQGKRQRIKYRITILNSCQVKPDKSIEKLTKDPIFLLPMFATMFCRSHLEIALGVQGYQVCNATMSVLEKSRALAELGTGSNRHQSTSDSVIQSGTA